MFTATVKVDAPKDIEVHTFLDLIKSGMDQGVPVNNGFPWSFKFKGYPVTHETNQDYLILDGATTRHVTPNHVILSDGEGILDILTIEAFLTRYTLK